MYIVRIVQGGTHQRLMQEAKDLVRKFDSWYIQFPKFTYIRVQGFAGCPYKLPSYPIDKMISLEVTKQFSTYDKIQRSKHRAGIIFPITIGKMI